MGVAGGKNQPPCTAADLQSMRGLVLATMHTGRPSKFNAYIAAEIAARIERGETITSVARLAHMPGLNTMYDWMRLNSDFSNAIAAARSKSATSLVDDGRDLLDNVTIDPEQPKVAMAALRKAEQQARYRFETAKCYDRDTFGDKREIKSDVNVVHSVGGLLASIMGDTPAAIEVDAELIDCG